MQCSTCGSLTLKETLTPELKHYARLDCSDCGAFVKWMLNPETGGYKKELEVLLEKARRNNAEDKFFQSLHGQFKKKGFLSNKQKECLERMARDE